MFGLAFTVRLGPAINPERATFAACTVLQEDCVRLHALPNQDAWAGKGSRAGWINHGDDLH